MDNDYIEVLNFLEEYAGVTYKSPVRVRPQEQGDEFRLLREHTRTALDKMYTICENCASRINYQLIIANRKNWLRGDNRAIRDYFWVQLKHKDYSNRPISISIFAESPLQSEPYFYRLALEIDEKNTTPEDYRAYKRYSDLLDIAHPIDIAHLRFFVLQDNNLWSFCDEPNERQSYITQMNNSDDCKKRVQPSYYISRTSDVTNTDRTLEEFEQMFHDRLLLLIPYYNHVMNCY